MITGSPPTNLGPRQRRRRLVMGFAGLAAAVAVAVASVALGWPPIARAAVFAPAWMGAIGLLQARASTCVDLARRGVCNFDSGEQRLQDAAVAEALRRRGRAIARRATILAALLTLLVLVFPA